MTTETQLEGEDRGLKGLLKDLRAVVVGLVVTPILVTLAGWSLGVLRTLPIASIVWLTALTSGLVVLAFLACQKLRALEKRVAGLSEDTEAISVELGQIKSTLKGPAKRQSIQLVSVPVGQAKAREAYFVLWRCVQEIGGLMEAATSLTPENVRNYIDQWCRDAQTVADTVQGTTGRPEVSARVRTAARYCAKQANKPPSYMGGPVLTLWKKLDGMQIGLKESLPEFAKEVGEEFPPKAPRELRVSGEPD